MATAEAFITALHEAMRLYGHPERYPSKGWRDLIVPGDFFENESAPFGITPTRMPMRFTTLIEMSARGWVEYEDGNWFLSTRGYNVLKPALNAALSQDSPPR